MRKVVWMSLLLLVCMGAGAKKKVKTVPQWPDVDQIEGVTIKNVQLNGASR